MKNKLLLALSAVAIVSAVALKASTNKPEVAAPVVASTVLNEQELFKSSTNKFPALIRLVDENSRAYCSGSVISDKLVLTAAHCVARMGEWGEVEVNPKVFIRSLSNKSNHQVVVVSVVLGVQPRADYALIKGDFRGFNTLKFNDKPSADILVNKYNLTACGFPYGQSPVCYPFTNPEKYVDVIKGKGQMYAGMSGGPVIDIATSTVYAVNSAVTDSYVMVAPIVNILGGK